MGKNPLTLTTKEHAEMARMTANPTRATSVAQPAARVRTRARALDLQPVANDNRAEQEANVREHLIAFWQANAAANAAAGVARKAKTALQKVMDETKIDKMTAFVVLEQKSVTVEAEIAPGEADYIDVAKLKELVDAETFMKIVKATKTDVIAHAGNNVAVAATSTKAKPADLKVKELK
jgi:hypothetical protein